MKYNLALLPKSQEVEEQFIYLAEEICLSRKIFPNYLLKKKLSLPHISVFQFDITKSDNNNDLLNSVSSIYNEAFENTLSKYNVNDICCTLSNKINYKYSNSGVFAGLIWAELLLNNNKILQYFHNNILGKLMSLDISPINTKNGAYIPHITLFNFSRNQLKKTIFTDPIPKKYKLLHSEFSLCPVLGEANNNWELIVIRKNI
ncbi:MAG: hypothetical protein HRT87_08805 [Legionellales bacterium]|nr:hypothetical protein [Legionellales bacterium]